MELSENFKLSEFIYSRQAIVNGLDNTPPKQVLPAIKNLVVKLLQPLRERYGIHLYITSGYRCEEVNRLCRGAADSQHLVGEAVDCYSPGARLLDVLEESKLNFDQAIYYRRKHILHLSLKYKGRNRRQIIYK